MGFLSIAKQKPRRHVRHCSNLRSNPVSRTGCLAPGFQVCLKPSRTADHQISHSHSPIPRSEAFVLFVYWFVLVSVWVHSFKRISWVFWNEYIHTHPHSHVEILPARRMGLGGAALGRWLALDKIMRVGPPWMTLALLSSLWGTVCNPGDGSHQTCSPWRGGFGLEASGAVRNFCL